MTMNMYNEYGSFYVETEALLAIGMQDLEYARQVLDQMSVGKRRALRRQVLRLYWLVGEGVSRVEDIEEMMGDLMMIANDTAPKF